MPVLEVSAADVSLIRLEGRVTSRKRQFEAPLTFSSWDRARHGIGQVEFGKLSVNQFLPETHDTIYCLVQWE